MVPEIRPTRTRMVVVSARLEELHSLVNRLVHRLVDHEEEIPQPVADMIRMVANSAATLGRAVDDLVTERVQQHGNAEDLELLPPAIYDQLITELDPEQTMPGDLWVPWVLDGTAEPEQPDPDGQPQDQPPEPEPGPVDELPAAQDQLEAALDTVTRRAAQFDAFLERLDLLLLAPAVAR